MKIKIKSFKIDSIVYPFGGLAYVVKIITCHVNLEL